jgi:hypothetical protein
LKRAKLSPEIESLYKGVDDYVKSLGGNVIVIGGIEVQEWPVESQFEFKIAVRCIGKKPTKFLNDMKNKVEDFQALPVPKLNGATTVKTNPRRIPAALNP